VNCKPGDLATIIGANRYSGWLVEVLHAAPSGVFPLPDGYPCACGSCGGDAWQIGDWVVRSLCSQFTAPLEDGRTRLTWYGVANDRYLRPLPGESEQTQQEESANV
jgi:hypothetical protein